MGDDAVDERMVEEGESAYKEREEGVRGEGDEKGFMDDDDDDDADDLDLGVDMTFSSSSAKTTPLSK